MLEELHNKGSFSPTMLEDWRSEAACFENKEDERGEVGG